MLKLELSGGIHGPSVLKLDTSVLKLELNAGIHRPSVLKLELRERKLEVYLILNLFWFVSLLTKTV